MEPPTPAAPSSPQHAVWPGRRRGVLPENKTFKVAAAPAPAGSFSLKSLFASLAPAGKVAGPAAAAAAAPPAAAAAAAEITAAKTAAFL